MNDDIRNTIISKKIITAKDIMDLKNRMKNDLDSLVDCTSHCNSVCDNYCKTYCNNTPPPPPPPPAPPPPAPPAPPPAPPQRAYYPNAQVVGDWFYARNGDGSIQSGHCVYNYDRIQVEDVSYSRQLVLCIYPITGTPYVREAYIQNIPSMIIYDNDHQCTVTAGTLNTRQTPGGEIIGYVSRGETVTIIGYSGGYCNIVYNTNKGWNTKSGWVDRNYVYRPY